MRWAYYNENDPKAAAWLRELMARGVLMDGYVDDRSIVDVAAEDLEGFIQCHFFAGVGVWSYALRCAGWPEDREIWTGSCPCQPFSQSGKRKGMTDDRHLWPIWFDNLIDKRRPASIVGEQVASPDGLDWLDLVQISLESTDYAFGAADLCAPGVGAPHIRQRLYWLAHAISQRRARESVLLRPQEDRRVTTDLLEVAGGGKVGDRVGHTSGPGFQKRVGDERVQREAVGTPPGEAVECGSHPGGLADDTVPGWGSEREDGDTANGGEAVCSGETQFGRRGATRGFWSPADWIPCRDGKLRPVEPGTFPLAHGAPARVGRLRGYGNAIVAPLATAFIEAYLDIIN